MGEQGGTSKVARHGLVRGLFAIGFVTFGLANFTIGCGPTTFVVCGNSTLT